MPTGKTLRIDLLDYVTELDFLGKYVMREVPMDEELLPIVIEGIVYFIVQGHFNCDDSNDEADMWLFSIELLEDKLTDLYYLTDMEGLEQDVAGMICESYVETNLSSQDEFCEIQDHILNIVEYELGPNRRIHKADYSIGRSFLRLSF